MADKMRLMAQDEKARAELRPRARKVNRVRRGKQGTRDEITVSKRVAREVRPYVFGDEA